MWVHACINRWKIMGVGLLLLMAAAVDASGAWMAGAGANQKKINRVLKMYSAYKKDFPEVVDVSAIGMQSLLARDAVLFIDVRTQQERAVSMLPGAVSEAEFLQTPSLARGKTAVAYCTIGYRSGLFAKKMAARGRRVLNLAGGILAWVLEGGKVYHDGKITRRVHVYGKKWNILPNGYEAVMFGFMGS
jgi:sodium/bile acid cotransporter 7